MSKSHYSVLVIKTVYRFTPPPFLNQGALHEDDLGAQKQLNITFYYTWQISTYPTYL